MQIKKVDILIKELINEFIAVFGLPTDNEKLANTHIKIKWNKKQYFIPTPESCILYNKIDTIIYNYLDVAYRENDINSTRKIMEERLKKGKMT